MFSDNNIIIDTMKNAALKGGKIIKKYFDSKEIRIDLKHQGEIVTNIDFKVQGVVIEILKSRLPDFTIISEEKENKENKTDNVFYLDPIDGTLNFTQGLGLFCVSIGYWKYGEPIAGTVYNPVSNELFRAYRGKGAYKNDSLIKVSNKTSIKDCLISSGWPYDKKKFDYIKNRIFCLMKEVSEIRFLGSAAIALCYVASGILDGFWECALYPWDIAGGIAIVLEAGAKITTITEDGLLLDGQVKLAQNNEVLLSNIPIHDDMIKLLKKL